MVFVLPPWAPQVPTGPGHRRCPRDVGESDHRVRQRIRRGIVCIQCAPPRPPGATTSARRAPLYSNRGHGWNAVPTEPRWQRTPRHCAIRLVIFTDASCLLPEACDGEHSRGGHVISGG